MNLEPHLLNEGEGVACGGADRGGGSGARPLPQPASGCSPSDPTASSATAPATSSPSPDLRSLYLQGHCRRRRGGGSTGSRGGRPRAGRGGATPCRRRTRGTPAPPPGSSTGSLSSPTGNHCCSGACSGTCNSTTPCVGRLWEDEEDGVGEKHLCLGSGW
ncbi:hypothetical protein [Oryza sativa Japonica Group]|uniref:Uncharacterized protein n=1 Tax=Oryza sativa subsp. japonica TaxID=39947 RepID=Q5JL82_ORYSJ|nr:hypothetical protein DAI22_01g198350 [Oryza sativa Japonica Group]BAD87772.1 hypothetical protein [Oryza sativa Japonica Group]